MCYLCEISCVTSRGQQHPRSRHWSVISSTRLSDLGLRSIAFWWSLLLDLGLTICPSVRSLASLIRYPHQGHRLGKLGWLSWKGPVIARRAYAGRIIWRFKEEQHGRGNYKRHRNMNAHWHKMSISGSCTFHNDIDETFPDWAAAKMCNPVCSNCALMVLRGSYRLGCLRVDPLGLGDAWKKIWKWLGLWFGIGSTCAL